MSSALIDQAMGPPEFELVRALCHATFAPADPDVTMPVTDAVNWSRFLDLTSYHRVEGLVSRGIAATRFDLPPKIKAALDQSAARIAASNLQMVRECDRLLAEFAKGDIPALFVKGLTLAKLAYGDVSAKSAADIDMLVEPHRIDDAARLLSTIGYRPRSPGRIAAIPAWHRRMKESLWIHERTGVALDLHSRLAESPQVIPTFWPDRPTRDIAIGYGVSLPTLGRDELAAYLAVHGVSSAWFRLKWIADFAALIEREHAGRLRELRSAMRELGAHHMGEQALLLSDTLFGSLRSDPGLQIKIARNRAVRIANAISLSYLHRAVEPTSVRGGTVGIHAAQILLLDNFGARASEVLRKARLLIAKRPD